MSWNAPVSVSEEAEYTEPDIDDPEPGDNAPSFYYPFEYEEGEEDEN